MLPIKITEEYWDEAKEEFLSVEAMTLELEHSLVSLSKWESKWHKPFFSKEEKTPEETIDYVKCMTLNEHVDPKVYDMLTAADVAKINAYIEDSMTATWFNEEEEKKRKSGKGGNKEQVTSELIYYWMIALNIPQEYQYWHLNRLITLIRVCEIKNEPPKKMSKKDIFNRNAAINAANKKRFNTKG